ncbi:MAG: tetratricopeptide repeat protein [Leptospiraceae bacterium]|nr:tetratricopeptide repeat protein [Leptospiraceae bacterium]
MKNLKFFKISIVLCVLVSSPLFTQVGKSEPTELKEAKKSYSQKSYATALKQFQSYADSHPNDGTPYVYMGYIYESKKDFNKSISMFRKAVDADLSKSHRNTSLLKLALYYNYYQEWDLAASYSSKYLNSNPGNAEVQKIYERASANRGKTPSRITHHSSPSQSNQSDDSPSQSKKTKSEYEALLSKNPNDEETRWELALIAFNEKDYKKAESYMKPLVTKFPTKPSYSYKLGVTLSRLEKYFESLEYFQASKKHIPEDDKNFLYFLNLNEGISLYKLKRYTEAEESLLSAYKYNNKDTPLIALVYLYNESSNWEKCLSTSERILKDNSNNLEISMYNAICKYESNNKNALPLFTFESKVKNKYSKLESIPETLHLGFLKIAREYTNLEKYSIAENYFQMIQKTYPEDREYLFYRGKANYYSGNAKKALPLLLKVDRSSAAYFLTAKSYASLGEQSNTEKFIIKATEIKESYWDLALTEDDFEGLRKNQSFMEFLKTKGKVSSLNNSLDANQTKVPNPSQSPTTNPE